MLFSRRTLPMSLLLLAVWLPMRVGAQESTLVPAPPSHPTPIFRGRVSIPEILAPARQGNRFELDVYIAPAHVRSESRGSLLLETALTYRGARPFYVRGRISPLAAPLGEPSRFAMGRVTLGLDHRYFELGAGIGAARLSDARLFPCTRNNLDDCTWQDVRGGAVALAFETRLGARDGLSFSLAYVYIPRLRYAFAQIDTLLQIPVAQVVALQLRMTTTEVALGYSQLGFGIRVRVHGTGASRSLFVTPGFSALAVPNDTHVDNVSVALGLAATLGIEYRP